MVYKLHAVFHVHLVHTNCCFPFLFIALLEILWSMARGLKTMKNSRFRWRKVWIRILLPLVEVLATKDMLEYGTRGISEQLYGLPTEMTRLSMELELSDLQQMAISRYGIQAVGSFIGIREIVKSVVYVKIEYL